MSHSIERYIEPYQSCDDCEVTGHDRGYDVKICESHLSDSDAKSEGNA